MDDQIADIVLTVWERRHFSLPDMRPGEFDALPRAEDGLAIGVPTDRHLPVALSVSTQANRQNVFPPVLYDAASTGNLGWIDREPHLCAVAALFQSRPTRRSPRCCLSPGRRMPGGSRISNSRNGPAGAFDQL